MNNKTLKTLTWVGLAAIVLAMLAGCSTEDDTNVLSPSFTETEPAPVVQPPAPEVVEPTLGDTILNMVNDSPDVCYTLASDLGTAREGFANSCPTAQYRDCDEIEGQWVCADQIIGEFGAGSRQATQPFFFPTLDQQPVVVESNEQGAVNDTPTSEPESPTTPTLTPTLPTGVSSSSLTQAFNASGVSGWVEYSEGGFVWTSDSRIVPAGQGMVPTQFNVEPGTYEINISSRITMGNDPKEYNDAFLEVQGGTVVTPASQGPFKVFQQRLGDWNDRITFEYPQHSFGQIVVTTNGGPLFVIIHGRSNGFAIRSITLTRMGGVLDSAVSGSSEGSASGDQVYTGPLPQRAWADSYSIGGQCYISSTFDHGAGDIVIQTAVGPRTVREIAEHIGPGPGIGSNPIYNDVQCGNGPPNNAGDEDPDQCPGRVDQGRDGCYDIGPVWDLGAWEISPTLPFLGLHFDNASDPDDMQAAALNSFVLREFGVGVDQRVVVNATHGEGNGANAGWFNTTSRRIMSNIFPDTIDAIQNPDAAVERYANALALGQTIAIADGGPSDYTARVVRELQARGYDTSALITVVQHSDWNERHTVPSALQFLRDNTNYIRIDDGNFRPAGNDTARLNFGSGTQCAAIDAAMSQTDLAQAWLDGKVQVSRSAGRCADGSDAVELLHIVGDTTTIDFVTFIDRYIED